MPEREKADLLHAGSLSLSSGLVIIEQRRALPDVQVIQVPAPIAAGPEYGLAILSPEGQATLARFGFDPVGLARQPGEPGSLLIGHPHGLQLGVVVARQTRVDRRLNPRKSRVLLTYLSASWRSRKNESEK